MHTKIRHQGSASYLVSNLGNFLRKFFTMYGQSFQAFLTCFLVYNYRNSELLQSSHSTTWPMPYPSQMLFPSNCMIQLLSISLSPISLHPLLCSLFLKSSSFCPFPLQVIPQGSPSSSSNVYPFSTFTLGGQISLLWRGFLYPSLYPSSLKQLPHILRLTVAFIFF